MERKKIIIADDHALIREGIKALLNGNGKYEIKAEVSNGLDCQTELQNEHFDIAILDIDMPKKNGVELGRWIKGMQLRIKIVYLTSHADFFSFFEAWKLNPSGFLFKENALEELISCLDHIEKERQYLSPISKKMIEDNQEKIETYNTIYNLFKNLSVKEQQVLWLISQRKTTNEIADKLFNSYKTIENHRYNICKKLNIKGNNSLVIFAVEYCGLINNLIARDLKEL